MSGSPGLLLNTNVPNLKDACDKDLILDAKPYWERGVQETQSNTQTGISLGVSRRACAPPAQHSKPSEPVSTSASVCGRGHASGCMFSCLSQPHRHLCLCGFGRPRCSQPPLLSACLPVSECVQMRHSSLHQPAAAPLSSQTAERRAESSHGRCVLICSPGWHDMHGLRCSVLGLGAT